MLLRETSIKIFFAEIIYIYECFYVLLHACKFICLTFYPPNFSEIFFKVRLIWQNNGSLWEWNIFERQSYCNSIALYWEVGCFDGFYSFPPKKNIRDNCRGRVKIDKWTEKRNTIIWTELGKKERKTEKTEWWRVEERELIGRKC